MTKIALFDTSVASENIGDQIIMRAVDDEIERMYPDAFIVRLPTHEVVSRHTYRIVRESDIAFVGGTNLLSSNMNSYNQWRINLLDAWSMDDIVLLGVGWWQYQDPPNLYTSTLLRQVLSSTWRHSVRDAYTKEMLGTVMPTEPINTGCPTTWILDEEHCADIPASRSSRVVCMLTDYNEDRTHDQQLLDLLRKHYDTVYFWPQGGGDARYLKTLEADGIEVLPPTLKALLNLLSGDEDLDYVGTRLHGGILSMRHKRRSIILSIDNRAKEMGKDLGFETVPRGETDALEERILADWPTRIDLPTKEINAWRNQFVDRVRERHA